MEADSVFFWLQKHYVHLVFWKYEGLSILDNSYKSEKC